MIKKGINTSYHNSHKKDYHKKDIFFDLQDYMFTSKNINRFTKHIIIFNNENIIPKSSLKNIEINLKETNNQTNKNNIKETIKETIKENVKKYDRKKETMYRPKQKDSLFWCFYILKYGFSNYEMEINNQYFVVEKNEKFKYIELLRKNKDLLKLHKIKPLTNVYVCGHNPEYEYTLKEGEIEYQDVSEDTVAEIIKGGNIVALYQGKAESGPRALGNRSLLFDPRVANGKDIVNSVKGRESFRPFAASILEEDASDWFEMRGLTSSPFMMYALDGKEIAKTQVPAVIHLDGTCRIQTVSEEQNPVFYKLIKSFKEKTGVPLLMNTSFNLGFEPIIETITNAIDSCRKSKIDYLYLPDIKKMIYFP